MKREQSRWLIVTASSFVLAAAFLLHFFPFVQVRENSMQPTLHEGDLLLLSRLAYVFSKVRPGDVLAFKAPPNWLLRLELQPTKAQSGVPLWAFGKAETRAGKPNGTGDQQLNMIKRCVLTAENQLRWRGSSLYIPYLKDYVQVKEKVWLALEKREKLPKGYIFVLGDNSANSTDSRSYGLVPVWRIQGKALWLGLLPKNNQ